MAFGLRLRTRAWILLGVIAGHALILFLPGPRWLIDQAPMPLQIQIQHPSGEQALPSTVTSVEDVLPKQTKFASLLPPSPVVPAKTVPMPMSVPEAPSPAQLPIVEPQPVAVVNNQGPVAAVSAPGSASLTGVAMRDTDAGKPVPAVRLLPRCDTRLQEGDYPRDLRRDGVEGRVVVKAQVLASGQVEVEGLAGSSGFARLDEAALLAARRWRCIPASVNGSAVAMRIAVPVVFRLDD